MNLSMLKQAQELKAKLEKSQEELGNIVVEADAGRGAIKVTANGQQKILSIKISPDVVDPNQTQKLEELLLKAVNGASDKAQKVAAKQLQGLTGGLKIPGLF